MKRIISALLTLTLIVTMIPSIVYAETTKQWDNHYNIEEGDLILFNQPIYAINNRGEDLTVTVEIDVNEPNNLPPWGQEFINGTKFIKTEIINCNGYGYCSSPVLAAVDDIQYDAEKNQIKYLLHEVTSVVINPSWPTNGVFKQNEVIMAIDNFINEGFCIKTMLFEDGEHEVPYLCNGNSLDFDKSLEAKLDENIPRIEIISPVAVRLDKIKIDETNHIITLMCREENWSGIIEKGSIIGDYCEIGNIFNNMLTPLQFEVQVFSDAECNNLVTEQSYSYTTTVNSDSNKHIDYIPPENIRIQQIVDKAMEENKVIVKCSLVRSEISKDNLAAFERLKEKAANNIKKIEKKSLHIKLADPDKMGIDGYGKREALRYLSDPQMLFRELGIQYILYDDDLGDKFGLEAYAGADLYTDKELTQEAIVYNGGDWEFIEASKYYLSLSYGIYAMADKGDGSISDDIKLPEPIEITFEFVEPNQEAVKQIKANSNKDAGIILEDLAWINSRINTSLDAYLPPVNNPQAFLKILNSSLYEDLVGDTNLDINIVYGMAGDALPFVGGTAYSFAYYLDDVYYGYGQEWSYDNPQNIYTRNVIYVPEGTSDRAKVAEKRIRKYIGNDSFKAEVDAITMQELVDLCYEIYPYTEIEKSAVKAAYLTEYGVFAYSDENLTDEANCLGSILPIIYAEEIFNNGDIEQVGYVDCIKDNYSSDKFYNVKAFKPYILKLTDKEKNLSKNYLYVIDIGTEEQLKEPYADWTDADTDIKIKGQNGYVPFDAYTKIRVIKGGKEIKFIQDKIGSDKTVHAYDINAYTNFKDGKLEDLGNGLMKIMIPLGVLSEDGVKAHYVDDSGNVQDLQYSIEEVGGKKYVCFITNHFSTYAISGVSTAGSGTTEEKKPSVPTTSDNNNLELWLALMIMTGVGAVTLKKKEED